MFGAVSDRYEGWYGKKFKRDNSWQPIMDAGSRGRKAVMYKCDVTKPMTVFIE